MHPSQQQHSPRGEEGSPQMGGPRSQRLGEGVLVVRVLSLRNVLAASGAGGDAGAASSSSSSSTSKRTTRASVKLRVMESNTTKRTRPAEVLGGAAEVNEEILFEGTTRHGLLSPDSLLEISVAVEIPIMLRSASRKKTVGNVYVPITAFCDVGSETTTCWIPLSDGDSSVKVSIFWRSDNDSERALSDSVVSPLALSNNHDASGDFSPPLSPPSASVASPTAAAPSSRFASFLSLRRSGSSGGTSITSSSSMPSSSSSVIPPHAVKRPHDVVFAKGDEQFAQSISGSRVDVSRVRISLTLHQAKDVMAANLIDGKSDPYCTIMVRGSRGKTKVRRATLAPVWEETFEFGRVEDLHPDDQFALVVKDWDQLGRNHDLGQILVNVSEILSLPGAVVEDVPSTGIKKCEVRRLWMDLAPTIEMKPSNPNGKTWGRMQLSFVATFPPSFFATLNGSNISSPQPPPPQASSLAVTSTSTKKERPRLVVRLIQARNLVACDSNGKSDPYFVLKVRGEERRTPPRKRTLNPLLDVEFAFGERDFLSDRDELKLSVFDKDFGIGSAMDDAMGDIIIPLWSLPSSREDSEPKWYALSSPDFRCAGEVQLQCFFRDPAKELNAVDIYKGKVWLWEMQVTVLEAKNLRGLTTDSCACDVRCGRDKWRTKPVRGGKGNPVWQERFRFRKSADVTKERDGLAGSDELKVTVLDAATGRAVGGVSMDVAYVAERLGYVDPSGKHFTAWFPLEVQDDRNGNSGGDHGDGGDDDDDDGDTSGDDMGGEEESTSAGGSSSSMTPVRGGLRRFLGRPFASRRKASVSTAPPLSSTRSAPASASSLSSNEDASDTLPSLRLRVRLVPIGETRAVKTRRVAWEVSGAVVPVPVASAEGGITTPAATSNPPTFVYAKLELGIEEQETGVVPFRYDSNLNVGRPLFHSTHYFADGIDWVLAQTAEKKKHELVENRRKRQLRIGSNNSSSRRNNPFADFDPDRLRVTIIDADTDRPLATYAGSLAELAGAGNRKTSAFTGTLATPAQDVNNQCTIASVARTLTVKDELVPLLGHLHVGVLSLKTIKPHLSTKASSSLRVVVRFGGRAKSTTFPRQPENGAESFQFSVYNVFSPVVVELWESKSAAGDEGSATGGAGSRLSLSRLAASVITNVRAAGATAGNVVATTAGTVVGAGGTSGASGAEGEEEEGSGADARYGTLVGVATFSIFDAVEFEAKTVFAEDSITKTASENGFKLYFRDPSRGRIRASAWVRAKYRENLSGSLSPNPNPPLRPGRPFSFANFRHEVNRFLAATSWLSAFGAHVGRILNWESPARTLTSMVVITVICCVDSFSSRFLVVFPFCLLIHLINRHFARANGDFADHFVQNDESTDGLAGEIRVACVQAKLPLAAAGSSSLPKRVQCHVSLLSSPTNPKSEKLVGWTRPAEVSVAKVPNQGVRGASPTPAATTTITCNFTQSKAGYGIRASKSLMPAIESWKYPENSEAVPAFDFHVKNELVNEPLVVVTLLRARGLRAADANGKSDPFAVISITPSSESSPLSTPKANHHGAGAETRKSQIRMKTLEPVWGERFVLRARRTDCVTITLFDWDGIGKSDDFLGVVEIPLDDVTSSTLFPPGVGGRWLKLCSKKGSLGSTLKEQMVEFQDNMDKMNKEITQGFKDAVNALQRPSTFGGDREASGASPNPTSSTSVNPPPPLPQKAKSVDDPGDDWGEIYVHVGWIDLDRVDANSPPTPKSKPTNRVPSSPRPSSLSRARRSSRASPISSSMNSEDMVPASETSLGREASIGTQLDGNEENGGDEPKQLDDSALLEGNDESGGGNGGEAEEYVPPDSWTKCGARVAVDLFNVEGNKRKFMGRALVNVAALVESDDVREQHPVDAWFALDSRYAGAKEEEAIVGDKPGALGTIRLKVAVKLPDPKAKERQMALAEARRADKANLVTKIRMVNRYLNSAQNVLYNLNNRLERTKNLFNWSHPQKTKLVFNLFVFLFVLLCFIPSRFFILMVVLFFFTEHFRPMGTMGARFKHLLSQIPTDDDLKTVFQGEVVSAKCLPLSDRQLASSSSHASSSNSSTSTNSNTTSSNPAQPAMEGKALASFLRSVNPGSAHFSGHLYFAEWHIGKSIPGTLSRRFFVVTSVGLHYWPDREASEEKPPGEHILKIVKIGPISASTNAGVPHESAFFVECDGGKSRYVFVASSEKKAKAWVNAARESLGI